jgi:uncharacterized protein (TIGR04255 family)
MLPHHIYKRHFIKSVIFRIDFPIPIPSLDALERPNDFQRAVLNSFPILEETKMFKQETKMSPEGMVNNQKESRLYNFYNSDRTCHIGLESSFLFIEHTRYAGYDDFISLEELVFNSLFTSWPDTPVNRLGLRYLNEINLPNPTDILNWSQYINPNLLSALGLFGGSDKLTRYIVHSEFRSNDHFARIVTGIPNPDYPGLIRQRKFVIDIDLYTNEAVDKQEIRPKLDIYHDAVISYFENSITQPLRDYMDAEDHA